MDIGFKSMTNVKAPLVGLDVAEFLICHRPYALDRKVKRIQRKAYFLALLVPVRLLIPAQASHLITPLG